MVMLGSKPEQQINRFKRCVVWVVSEELVKINRSSRIKN